MAGNHARVNILVEGQTEETFVRELLAPHLVGFQVYLTPRIIETSKGHKGGRCELWQDRAPGRPMVSARPDGNRNDTL
jgi:hypothetical protein